MDEMGLEWFVSLIWGWAKRRENLVAGLRKQEFHCSSVI